MFAAAAPLVAGAAVGALGSWLGQSSANRANRDIANETNAMNAQLSRENMAFQERMSNTSWQRGVADMRAAGINPMLLVSKGAGASTPSGSALQAVTGAPMQNTMAGLPAIVNSAVSMAKVKAELDNIDAQTRLTNAQADTVRLGQPKKRVESRVYDTVNTGIDTVESSWSQLRKWFDKEMAKSHRSNARYQIFK